MPRFKDVEASAFLRKLAYFAHISKVSFLGRGVFKSSSRNWQYQPSLSMKCM